MLTERLRHCGGKTRHVIWKLSFLLELCSRSEMLSWTSVWIEFRSSSFARIDVDESFKCRTEYRILKYEHVKKYALMEWRIKATENWLYIQRLVTDAWEENLRDWKSNY